jgi:hypothetical protein
MLSIESLMNKKLKMVCNGSGRSLIKALSQHLRGGTEVNTENVPPHTYLQRWRYTNLNDHDGCDELCAYIGT